MPGGDHVLVVQDLCTTYHVAVLLRQKSMPETKYLGILENHYVIVQIMAHRLLPKILALRVILHSHIAHRATQLKHG